MRRGLERLLGRVRGKGGKEERREIKTEIERREKREERS